MFLHLFHFTKRTTMKISFTLFCLLISVCSTGQIVINSGDIPVPAGTFTNVEYGPTQPPAPSIGAGQTWDYSSFSGTGIITNIFNSETDPFFTMSGIDVNRAEFKDLTAQYSYGVIMEYDFNSNGVHANGISVPYQAYDLSAVTGNTQDSLIFPAQQYIFPNPKVMMEFPFTMNSSWHSQVRCSNDFDITCLSLGLNHTPGNHAYTMHRNDSIIGWGTMRVYTSTGPSIWYDVLMNKYEEYAIDSFYINGAPASPVLLAAFSVSQGQKTNANYGYNFYRSGSYNYLVRVDYATDSLYSFILGTYQNLDNILATSNIEDARYSTLVFPNPSNGSEVNVRIFGKRNEVKSFIVTDLTGQRVHEGTLEKQSDDLIRVDLDNLPAGEYILKLSDAGGNLIVTEKLTVRK